MKSSLEDLTNNISDVGSSLFDFIYLKTHYFFPLQLCDGYSDDLRKHAGRYQEVKTTLNAIERKETSEIVLFYCHSLDVILYRGSLILRSLNGIVKKEHVVSGEYIKTLIVVVPRYDNTFIYALDHNHCFSEKETDFLETYEHLEDNIPPEDLPQPMSKHGTVCRIIVPGSALSVFMEIIGKVLTI